MATDPVIAQGNGCPITYRYEDLLMRRRLAALAGQHRTVQRYTKKLALFRAAFDMPQEDDEPSLDGDGKMAVFNAKTGRDPDAHQDLASLQSYDAKWARATTARGMAKVAAALEVAGFVTARKSRDSLTTWNFTRGDTRVDIQVVGDSFWTASASVNGNRLPIFDFQHDEDDLLTRGIPQAIAADGWDGKIDAKDARSYVVSFARLIKMCGEL